MRASLGVAFLLCVMPLAWIIRYLTAAGPSILFPGTVVAVSILFITNFRRLLAGEVLGTTASWLGPIVALISMAALGLISAYVGLGLLSGNAARDPFYFTSCLALLVAAHTAGIQEFDQTALAAQDISILSCSAFLIQCALQGASSGKRFAAGDSDSPNQMAFVAGIGLLASAFVLLSSNSTRLQRLRAYLGTLIGAVAILLTATRSVLFGLVLCLLVGMSQLLWVTTISRRSSRVVRRTIGIGFLLVCSGTVVYSAGYGEFLTAYAREFQDYLDRGYEAYVVGVVSTEYSAEIRRSLIVYAITEMNLIGHGYRHTFIDFPLLQAFWDGGLVWGTVFLVTTVILPLHTTFKILKSRASTPPGVMFICYLYILFLPNLVFHGQPYDYTLWFPIVLFYAVCRRRSRGSDVSADERRRVIGMSQQLIRNRAYGVGGRSAIPEVRPTS